MAFVYFDIVHYDVTVAYDSTWTFFIIIAAPWSSGKVSGREFQSQYRILDGYFLHSIGDKLHW